jgi:tRNA (uracil-5-)-methyltransferase TRM9
VARGRVRASQVPAVPRAVLGGGAQDYALSIATIHHLASRERRVRAVQVCIHPLPHAGPRLNMRQRLLEAVAPSHGRVLIYVWATEQDALSKREVPADTGDGQDVFVPWVLGDGLVERRYYHMFARGELRALVDEATSALGGGVQVVQEGWERSNHYVELRRYAQ